jgi:hypothetical protein
MQLEYFVLPGPTLKERRKMSMCGLPAIIAKQPKWACGYSQLQKTGWPRPPPFPEIKNSSHPDLCGVEADKVEL